MVSLINNTNGSSEILPDEDYFWVAAHSCELVLTAYSVTNRNAKLRLWQLRMAVCVVGRNMGSDDQ